jgi:Acyl-CoA reductase (LuxC).
METRNFIKDFATLGEVIKQLLKSNSAEFKQAINLAHNQNPYFTPFMQENALQTICNTFLVEKELCRWLSNYPVLNINKNIAIIMAGNIPLVGFHDFLCVMASGSTAFIKLSSKDKILLPFLANELIKINNYWEQKIIFINSLPDNLIISPAQLTFPTAKISSPIKIDSLIFTGSSATAKIIEEKYFAANKLIRGRRFSFAVLSGKESEKELESLAKDVFLYYGLGCRSVNYIWVPVGYDFSLLIENFSKMQTLCKDACYMNNFKRRRALLTLQGEEFIDGGFFVLVKDVVGDMYPPIGEIRYREYDSLREVDNFVEKNKEQIQKKYCNFGIAQAPLIDEYADNIDTLAFILQK